jgi:serine protease Do
MKQLIEQDSLSSVDHEGAVGAGRVRRIVGFLGIGVLLWSLAFGSFYYLNHSDAAPIGSTAVSAQPVTIAPPAQGFIEIAKNTTPAVVNITASKEGRGEHVRKPSDRSSDPMDQFFGFRGPREPRGMGMGSGVIVSPNGYIITNNHVVEGAREVTVTLPDKRELKGKVVGTDPKTDLAMIKVDGLDLPFIPWGDSSALQVGESVLAVGNPFGLNSTVTSGIVSALGRGGMGITQYEDFIQTDAAINPGNSGGALVNTRGELVGINTAIMSQTGGYQGVGFAVPSTMAKPIAESLIKTGKVVRGHLGIGIQDLTPDLVKSFGLDSPKGALVSDVKDDSPAAQAGLKQGDVITTYQGTPVDSPRAIQRAVTQTPIGAKVTIRVVRNGREQEVTATIGEQPDTAQVAKADHGDAEHALAGVVVKSLDSREARELGLSGKAQGVLVVGVEPDSKADRAGLTEGDVITEVNRQPVKSVQDFERAAVGLKKDQNGLLLIYRRGAALFLTVKA